jgi:hypothetical protein
MSFVVKCFFESIYPVFLQRIHRRVPDRSLSAFLTVPFFDIGIIVVTPLAGNPSTCRNQLQKPNPKLKIDPSTSLSDR